MKCLKFTLSGKSAFFKKPDVNSVIYFTYGNIHKVALIGLFGAILGYKGYNSKKLEESLKKSPKKKCLNAGYPEFYEKLKELKVSICPNNEKGFIPKKVQVFNNSVGYASKENGGNLIVKEQVLENPSWDIYFIIDDEQSEKLAKSILENKSVYTPYLGKNDHFADIKYAKIIEGVKIDDVSKINCLCFKKNIEIDFKNDMDSLFDFDSEEDKEVFKYEEKLPIQLNEYTNLYVLESFIYTNMNIKSISNMDVYKVKDRNIVFY